MSVVAALFSGISGIVANGSALAVAGDNISNMSTPGFKSSVAVFESALSQRIGNAEIGLGGRLAGTTANFSQGGFQNSTRATDLAIQGSGFFIVDSEAGTRFYTRAGIFERNSDGNLVTSAGKLLLQGYSIDDTGATSGTLDSVNLANVTSSPEATSEIKLSLNLDAGSEILAGSLDGSSFSAAEASSNFNVTTTVYDSLGNARTVVTYFRHTASNEWTYHVLTSLDNLSNGNDTSVNGDGTGILTAGTITYNSDGSLNTAASSVALHTLHSAAGVATSVEPGEQINPASASPQNLIQWADGATAETIMTIDFGQVAGTDAVSTQYSSASIGRKVEQDGRSVGDLQSIAVTSDGKIAGVFSNGITRDIFKLPLASFANEEGLSRAGSNLYSESTDSGLAQLGDAQTAGRGEVRSFSIEQSNTDLAAEFVKVITFQRAFQASSRTVSTAAELLQDLVNIGR